MEVYMNKKKLSLLFTVSLATIGSIHSSFNIVWSEKLGRHINKVTGRMVKSKGVLKEFAGMQPYSAITTVEAKTARSFVDGAYSVVGAGVVGFMSGAEYLFGSKEQSESVNLDSIDTASATPSKVVIGAAAAVTAGYGSVIAWNVYKAKSKAAKVAAEKAAAENATQAEQPKVATTTTQVEQPKVAPVRIAPVVAPIKVAPVKQAPVVAPVKQAPVAKPVDAILKENANSPSGMITALKANGHGKTKALVEKINNLTTLNLGQKAKVISMLG